MVDHVEAIGEVEMFREFTTKEDQVDLTSVANRFSSEDKRAQSKGF